ncbi:MAG: hypothetical protein LRY71_15780, partial [Bacillaceae bacterium]|nr:hypothetical protein [Bacillaceae bacterium]
LRFSTNDGLSAEDLIGSVSVKDQEENLVEVSEVLITDKAVELVGEFDVEKTHTVLVLTNEQ